MPGEKMAAANVMPLGVLEDTVLRERLLMRISTTRGEAPLKKLSKKFFAFVAEVGKLDGQGEDGADGLTTIEKHYSGFMQELLAWEAPARKSRLAVAAYRQEQERLKDTERQIKRRCKEVRAAIEVHKRELIEAREERAHHLECEAVRNVIDMQPSRAESRRAAAALQRESADLEAAREQSRRTLALRRKQFSQLVQVIDELQDDMDEEPNALLNGAAGEDGVREVGRQAKGAGAAGLVVECDVSREGDEQKEVTAGEVTASEAVVAPAAQNAKVEESGLARERTEGKENGGVQAPPIAVEAVESMEVDAL